MTNMKEKTIIQHTYIGHIGEHALDWATDKERRKIQEEIDELKQQGIYGQPIDITWTLKELPEFAKQPDYRDSFTGIGFIIPDGGENIGLTLCYKNPFGKINFVIPN